MYNKYTYCKHADLANGKIRWQCSSNTDKGCRASAHTYEGMLLRIQQDHNHTPPTYITVNGKYVRCPKKRAKYT